MKAYEGKLAYAFISYAHKDNAGVVPILELLAAKGVRFWYDAGIEAGTEWSNYVAERLQEATTVVVFMSAAADRSNNCRDEINFARDLEKDILVVYLEDFSPSAGTKMRLGRLQALFLHKFDSKEALVSAMTEAPMIRSVSGKGAGQGKRTAQPKVSVGGKTSSDALKEDPHAELRRLAEAGDHDAENKLGNRYYSGQGVPISYETAFAWYQKSAAGGNEKAMCNLAQCYLLGNGVVMNKSLAFQWYYRAGEKGNVKALAYLAECYFYGDGVTRNYVEAAKCYYRAAIGGHVESQYNLAKCYEFGKGVNVNFSIAFDWYQKAAERGHAAAAVKVGQCYERGQCVAKDHANAFLWYQRAAKSGNIEGMIHLAYAYKYGNGVRQDKSEAAEWLRRAADLGSEKAQDLLRKMGGTV